MKRYPPVSRCFGQLILGFPVMRVEAEHEAASAQLGLRLLQLLRQVEHLARGVVRVLSVQQTNSHLHTKKPTHAQFANKKTQITDFST